MASKNSQQDFRAQARQIADKHAKADARQRLWIIAGIGALVVAIAVIAVLVVVQVRAQTIPEAGPVPASSNQYGGIVMTADRVTKNSSDVQEVNVKDVPEPGENPPTEVNAEGIVEPGTAAKTGDPVQVVIWQDFDCVHCADMEKQYGGEIADLVKNGDATVEYRTVNFLDNGTQYSSRAANAYYAVADKVDPEKALEFQKEVFTHQGTGGISDDDLIDIAAKHGADIKEDVKENRWRPMVNYTSALAQNNGVSGTPTVLIDGEQWDQKESIKKTVESAAKK